MRRLVAVLVAVVFVADASTLIFLDTSPSPTLVLHRDASYALRASSVQYAATEMITIGKLGRMRSITGATTFAPPAATDMRVAEGGVAREFVSTALGVWVRSPSHPAWVFASGYPALEQISLAASGVVAVLSAYYSDQLVDGRLLPALLAGARDGRRVHGAVHTLAVNFDRSVIFGPFGALVQTMNGQITVASGERPTSIVVHVVAAPVTVDVTFTPTWNVPVGRIAVPTT